MHNATDGERVGWFFRFPGMRWHFTRSIDDFGPDHTAEIREALVGAAVPK